MSIIEKAFEKMSENKSGQSEISQEIVKDTHQPARSDDKNERVASSKTSKNIHIDLDELEYRGFLTPNAKNKILFEQYRRIKMPLLNKAFSDRKATNNIIMVTSSLSGEGKSYTALNIAMSIAYEFNYTVLHVDADLIRKTSSKMLGLDDSIGLIQYLKNDTAELSDVILSTNIPKLNLLPAGIGDDDLITELFNSHRMQELIDELSVRYNDRIIIIDSPPIMLDMASRALLKLAKQTLFVVEAEKTPRYIVNDALEIIADVPNVGIVLNKSNQRADKNYGYYYK